MIGAIIKNDIVENLITLTPQQIPEMSKALNAEIVDARPYGLNIGDLRTESGWTRNADGEQIILPLLARKEYDSYSVLSEQYVETKTKLSSIQERTFYEALSILKGVDGFYDLLPHQIELLREIRIALDGYLNSIQQDTDEINSHLSIIRQWAPYMYYARNEIRIDPYDNIPYWALHDHTSVEGQELQPHNSPTIWAHYHGISPKTARPFVAEGHNPYKKDQYCLENDKCYKCLMDNIVYAPSVYPQAWAEVQNKTE